ncbi:hypothetical protein [Bacillus toyonensis]|uniref:hypothetical protein n=1 Tax=Bacillus toyonensis TaxID=155322 RepID=UPI000BECC6E9|nr:hypothetical protein [Bacillus toyonensis]MED2842719.1 hypothetical protein [Bacillus toyonensis]PEB17116.1 hypothetical protein COO08_18665 [Bacillus toyonensis]PEF99061.1 hypothetical protein COO01_08740 [Bacillus toyonensis]PGC08769.1 hypothetical protein COM20_04340 [Bacillus toyonensis]PHB95221.1 hypothetical protein COF04_26940 [Bacillus toyonensis]
MNPFPMRAAFVAPAATWQHLLQYHSYGQYGMQPGHIPFTPTIPPSPVIYQYHYNFPSLYFQEFHGTFNI